MDLKSKIRVVEDFPKKGISFKDITTLMQDPEAYNEAIDACIKAVEGISYDVVLGPEARGFLIGAPLALKVGKPFIPIRKPGKLPFEVERFEYDLEYGSDVLEIHKDAIKPGQKVLIADDLLATGGTSKAVCELVEKLGGTVVGLVFLIELDELPGRALLEGYDVHAVVHYDV